MDACEFASDKQKPRKHAIHRTKADLMLGRVVISQSILNQLSYNLQILFSNDAVSTLKMYLKKL